MSRVPEILALGALVVVAGTSHAEEITPPLDSRLEISFFLERVSEPTLWDTCKGKTTTTYRASKITPDRSVETVRITRTGDTITIRAATSRLGEDLAVTDESVTWEDWVQLEGFAQTIGFWYLISEWRTFRPDGTVVYIEGCRRGEYHAIKRKPLDFEIEDLMNHLQALATRAGS